MTTKVKERPILMHGRSTRNILAKRKTQTRRIVKPQPPENCCELDNVGDNEWETLHYVAMGRDQRGHIGYIKCPFGQPGDRLWVRETIQINGYLDLYYATDNKAVMAEPPYEWSYRGGEWKGLMPCIHMPRWASRLLLEITSIRIERIQDISEDDAKAEGANSVWMGPDAFDNLMPGRNSYREGFYPLWNETYGEGVWERNDWVWVIEFKVVTPS